MTMQTNDSPAVQAYDAALLEVEIAYACGTDSEREEATSACHEAWAALSDTERAQITEESDLLDAMGAPAWLDVGGATC